MICCRKGCDKMVYKILANQFIKRIGVLLLVISVWLAIDAIGACSLYIQKKGISYVVFATPYILGISFLVITGYLYSYYQYAGFLSIQAKRKIYLKGIISVGTIGSILLLSLVYGITQFATHLVRMMIPMDIVKNSFPLSLEGLIHLWRMGLVAFVVGFFIGALFYRFKRITAFCVISIPILTFMITLLSNYLFDNDASNYLMIIMMVLLKSLVGGSAQIIVILLFWIMAYRLLIKAPIKQYAHDLI